MFIDKILNFPNTPIHMMTTSTSQIKQYKFKILIKKINKKKNKNKSIVINLMKDLTNLLNAS